MEPINIPTSDIGKYSLTTPLQISEHCHLKIIASAIFNINMELKLQTFKYMFEFKLALKKSDQI